MKKIILASVLVSTLIGCALVTKVEPGDVVVGNKVTVKLDSAWNQLSPNLIESTALWTREGLPLDVLQFFVGIEDGGSVGKPRGKDQKPVTFKASMQPDELASMIEAFYTRDGSTFKLEKLEPTTFVGERGIKMRFSLVRKSDDVKLSGLAWAVVKDKQFHSMLFTAPKLGIFPRYEEQISKIALSAKLK